MTKEKRYLYKDEIEIIKDFMKKYSLNWKSFADIVNLEPQVVGKYVKGNIKVPLERIDNMFISMEIYNALNGNTVSFKRNNDGKILVGLEKNTINVENIDKTVNDNVVVNNKDGVDDSKEIDSPGIKAPFGLLNDTLTITEDDEDIDISTIIKELTHIRKKLIRKIHKCGEKYNKLLGLYESIFGEIEDE